MTNKVLELDFSAVDSLRRSLDSLSKERLGDVARAVVNEVADNVYDLARGRMNAGINLDDDYMRREMAVEHAASGGNSATITAFAKSRRLVHYDARWVLANKVSPRTRLKNGLMKLPSGQKQRGVSVVVKRGGGSEIGSAFLLPLAGGGGDNGYGVFMRQSGRLRQLYGPATYQLFRHQIQTIDDDVTEQLEVTLDEHLDQKIREALG